VLRNEAPREVPLELFIQCAETAVFLENFSIADECIKLFYSTDPARSQFYCRSLLVRANIASQRATEQAIKGDAYSKAVLAALDLVQEALHVAQKYPARIYGFLVYNCSLAYYNVARPLLRDNLRRLLAPSMTKVVEALEALPDRQNDLVWLIRYLVNLSACYDDAGSMDHAGKYINRAFALLKDLSANAKGGAPPFLIRLVIRYSVWVFRAKEGQLTPIANDLERLGMPHARAFFAVQKVRCGLCKPEEAEKILSQTLHQLIPSVSDAKKNASEAKEKESSPTKQSKDKGKKGKGKDKRGKKNSKQAADEAEDESTERVQAHGAHETDLDKLAIISGIGREAMNCKAYKLARECYDKTIGSKMFGPSTVRESRVSVCVSEECRVCLYAPSHYYHACGLRRSIRGRCTTPMCTNLVA
jgi:tetratricopeptide (TPR) repeat protein